MKKIKTHIMQKWISVKHELPKGYFDVLCYTSTGCEIGWHGQDSCWYTKGGSFMRDVTHWMPLPEPPKGE